MPHFQYTAVDSQGKTVEGTVMAATLREVSQGLRQRGLKVSRIVEAAGSVAPSQVVIPTAVAATVSAPVAALQPQPLSSPRPSVQAPPKTVAPAVQVVHTRRFRHKDIFLLFSQLANYLKTGISPQQAFQDLQNRVTRQDYARSLEDLRVASVAGAPISQTLERYPDLYPPHVVGLMRAGEQGGFLPQAAERVAKQANSSMRWARPFWIVTWMVCGMLVAMPLAFVMFQGMLDTWTVMDKTGGMASPLAVLAEKVSGLLVWPLGPAILLGLFCVYLITVWWRSRRMRFARHKLAATWPIFKKRSEAEGATYFSWALSNLSRSGVLPYTAWPLAVEAVPNLAYKARLMEISQHVRERTPISEALARAQVLPKEVTMMVQTGEATGSVPQALMDAATMSETEFDSVEQQSKRLVWSWIGLLYGLGFCFYLWLVYRYFYPELIRRVLEDIDPDTANNFGFLWLKGLFIGR